MSEQSRQRNITWEDPMKGASQAVHLSGLEYFGKIEKGELPLPPLLTALDFHAKEVEIGKAVFSFVPQEFHYNAIGTVHGGVISAILDTAMGCTLHSMLPAGTGYTTLELKVNFLKAVTTRSGELQAVGKAIHSGSRTALVEAQLVDGSGTVYAHGVSTCLLLNIG
ncbi:MAG TPA: PaaI family thioesterase [Dyadobacter sp.]|jgi:uncharacterized protein (TIGR00369 family)|nr:PaaI family thioesterase [Dyadobacter sp.]